jgi:phospholipase/lecithinase/hemolysin
MRETKNQVTSRALHASLLTRHAPSARKIIRSVNLISDADIQDEMPALTQRAAVVEPLEPRRLFAAAEPVVGIGVIGDSLADEYQFYPPDRPHARNFVEQLAEDRALNFGMFELLGGDRGEPRNAGYAFNWARDGATTSDVISQGQHTGLAGQISAGQVNYAWVVAGGNDVLDLASADDPAAAAASLGQTLLANGQTILSTLLAAKADLKIVIATVPRLGALPAVKAAVAGGQVSQDLVNSADDAIAQVNTQIRQIAKSQKQVALADVDKLLQQMDSKKHLRLGKVTLDRETPSDDPHSVFLADGVHPGTLAQGLLANVFVKAMRKDFKVKVKPLSNTEILANAGLQPNGEPVG